MAIEPQTGSTSDASPGQPEKSEELIRIYDALDAAGKQELLRLAEELARAR